MLFCMDRNISSNSSTDVFDTDDLTLEEVSCKDIIEYRKRGGTVVFPFHITGITDARVAVFNDWFIIYSMSHEPSTQGMYMKVGRLGKEMIWSKRVNIVWNAYPVLSFDADDKHCLITLDWTDKHYYGEDREEGLVKSIGLDLDGNEVLNTLSETEYDAKYYTLDDLK